ncbi:hypothetical protein KY284_000852 [Solanum tuberosum]|nr:hypothetical protein KY284_000852 [Solanum tuberosum]
MDDFPDGEQAQISEVRSSTARNFESYSSQFSRLLQSAQNYSALQSQVLSRSLLTPHK